MRKELSQIIPLALMFLIIGIFIGISFKSLTLPTTTTTTIGNCICPQGFIPTSDGTLCWQPCTSPSGQPKCTPIVAPCQSTTTTTTAATDCNYYCNYVNPPPVPPCINGTTIISGTGTYPNCQCSSKCIDCSTVDPNYCNTNDDCICDCSALFRGNIDYYNYCVDKTSHACKMNYCFFGLGEGMICVNHTCQIG